MSRDNRQHSPKIFYDVGSPSPTGYIARQEWAADQLRGGLRQKLQPCGHWLFPQEIDGHRCSSTAGEQR